MQLGGCRPSQGGTPDLKWWGGAKDFWGLEIHNFGIFWCSLI